MASDKSEDEEERDGKGNEEKKKKNDTKNVSHKKDFPIAEKFEKNVISPVPGSDHLKVSTSKYDPKECYDNDSDLDRDTEMLLMSLSKSRDSLIFYINHSLSNK